MNHLYYGDNLTVLRDHIASDSVDLIYLDPPFNSNAGYNVLFKAPDGSGSAAQIEAFDDTWHWNDSAESAFADVLRSGNAAAAEMLRAMRSFLGENDMMAYLAMMAARLIELHRVLKPTGSLYLHCDPTASHYLKILLDAVFGRKTVLSKELDWRHLTVGGNGQIWVIATEEEIEEYRSYGATRCSHPKSELRDYQTSNGGWQRKDQCLTCGASTSKAHKREKGIEVPPWDTSLQESWETKCRERQSLLIDKLIERTNHFESTGYVFYEDYLASAEWKSRRDLVMKRDSGLCQACLSAEASEVHHLTYDDIFREYLFQLVAVCRNCHEKLHIKKIVALEASRAKGLAQTQ